MSSGPEDDWLHPPAKPTTTPVGWGLKVWHNDAIVEWVLAYHDPDGMKQTRNVWETLKQARLMRAEVARHRATLDARGFLACGCGKHWEHGVEIHMREHHRQVLTEKFGVVLAS